MIDQTTRQHRPTNRGQTPRQRAIEAYDGARDRAADTSSEAPLLALAGGIAAGAVIAALLPRTRREDASCVGPTARRVKDSARCRGQCRQGHRPARSTSSASPASKGEETLRSLLEGAERRRQGLGRSGGSAPCATRADERRRIC